jgi:hypothetical protein
MMVMPRPPKGAGRSFPERQEEKEGICFIEFTGDLLDFDWQE